MRDYRNRKNFTNLVALNMMSPPTLDTSESKITFNGRTMNVGEVVYRIGEDANYKSLEGWTTAWEKESE